MTTTLGELLTTMTLFTATARAPVMTILIQVMAGDIQVDRTSRGLKFLMPLAVTGMPPSRDRRPVHSTAVQQEENSHIWCPVVANRSQGGMAKVVWKWTHHPVELTLCEMVQEDRASQNARDAEEWLMNSLRQQAGGGALMGSEREIDHAAL